MKNIEINTVITITHNRNVVIRC